MCAAVDPWFGMRVLQLSEYGDTWWDNADRGVLIAHAEARTLAATRVPHIGPPFVEWCGVRVRTIACAMSYAGGRAHARNGEETASGRNRAQPRSLLRPAGMTEMGLPPDNVCEDPRVSHLVHQNAPGAGLALLYVCRRRLAGRGVRSHAPGHPQRYQYRKISRRTNAAPCGLLQYTALTVLILRSALLLARILHKGRVRWCTGPLFVPRTPTDAHGHHHRPHPPPLPAVSPPRAAVFRT